MRQLLQMFVPQRTGALLAALLVTVLGVTVFAQPQRALADPAPGTVRILGPPPGLCFEVDGTTNGSLVRAAECDNNANQRFYKDPTSVYPIYRLRSYQVAGKCLDVSGASTAGGAHLILYTCVPTAYEQEFDFFNNTIRPTHIYGHTMCLTAWPYDHGTPVVQQPCGQAGQQWLAPMWSPW